MYTFINDYNFVFAGFVTAYWPKTLLVHGLKDTTVPDVSSRELAQALKQKGSMLSLLCLDSI